MLMLLFWIGTERWAIAAADIKDVLPLVNLQPVPHSHPVLAGLLNYRGEMVRTLDVSKMIAGKAAAPIMSTRVVVVQVAGQALGLVVERAEETLPLVTTDEPVKPGGYSQALLKYQPGQNQQAQNQSGVIHQLALMPLLAQALEQAQPLSEVHS